jgi:hypothetical protein
MVINDSDVFCIGACPREADAPLIVDADAVLAVPVPGKGFEAIAGREAEKVEFDGGIDELEFCEGAFLDVGGQAARSFSFPWQSCFIVGE